jgi:hypothetical protein
VQHSQCLPSRASPEREKPRHISRRGQYNQ